MSLFDISRHTKKANIRQLIGTAYIEDECQVSTSGEKTAYLIVAPYNLNVLSHSLVAALEDALENSIKEMGTVELLCVNSAQSYEANKHFLAQASQREKVDVVRELDRMDMDFLDDIQVHMATSRLFSYSFHFYAKTALKEVSATLEHCRQIATQNRFQVQTADKASIKRMLGIYYEQNIYDEEMQDFDGEKFSPILEVKK